MLDVREHLEGHGQLGIDAIISVRQSACVLVVLVEGAAPQMMNRQTRDYQLERISLLSAVLAPAIENVASIVAVTQVGLACWWFGMRPVRLKKNNFLRLVEAGGGSVPPPP